MGLLDLLFGKKEKSVPTAPAKREPTPPSTAPRQDPGVNENKPASRPANEVRTGTQPPEVENLRRWRESGQARSWVEAHKSGWDHQDWISLLETLQRSPYWPMQPEEVGRVLEELKNGSGGK